LYKQDCIFSAILANKSPETGFLNYRSCAVKTSFSHIPCIKQSKRTFL
jgi:hypothetical protein